MVKNMNSDISNEIWNSYCRRNTLFWTDSPERSDRNLRLARIGSIISLLLVSVAASAEVALLGYLLYEIVR